LETKTKLSRIDQIFLTELNWNSLGGLPGLILTIADVGDIKLGIAAPKGLLNFLSATRSFVYRFDATENYVVDNIQGINSI
jgi:ribonuclease Z